MIVTRPLLPTSGPLTRADLQELNNVVVAQEQSDFDATIEEAEDQLGDGVVKMNLAANPGLDQWTRGSTAVSCAVGVRQFRADHWWARLNATSSDLITYQRAAVNAQSFIYGAKITGAAGAGSVDFGQEIVARLSASLYPACTLTFTLANGTSTAITPQVRLDTCDTLEDFGTVTNRAAVNASSSVTAGNERTFSVSLDLSAAAAALRNGCLLYIRIPGGLTDAAKTVTLSAFKLERGDHATGNFPERDLGDPETTTNVERNWLDNAEFTFNRWLASPVLLCAAGAFTYAAEGWWVKPNVGSTLTYQRTLDGPGNGRTAWCAELLTTDAAVSDVVDFGQDLPARISRQLSAELVFSAWIWNATGSSITPLIRVDTPAAADDWTTPTNRESQTLQACPNGAWTQVSFSLNGSAWTNVANGVRIYLRFPAQFAAAARNVRIVQPKLEYGTAATEFVPKEQWEHGVKPETFSLDLSAVASSATVIALTTGWAVLTDAAGRQLTARTVSVSINAAVNGANGLDTGSVAADTAYYLWLIAGRNLAVAGLLSLSATAPTLPSGYTHKLRVGWTRYTSSDFRSVFQVGRSVRYAARSLFAAKNPGADTYVSVLTLSGLSAGYLLGYAPAFAQRLHGIAATSNATARAIALASGTSAGGVVGEGYYVLDCTAVTASSWGTGPFFNPQSVSVPLLPAANQDFLFRGFASAATYNLSLTGFDF